MSEKKLSRWRGLFEDGSENLDPKKIAIPAGFKRPENIQDMIQRALRGAARAAEAGGFETPEESDDFEVGDDFDPSIPMESEFFSPHELVFDQEIGRELPQEVKREVDARRAEFDTFVREKWKPKRKRKASPEGSGPSPKKVFKKKRQESDEDYDAPESDD